MDERELLREAAAEIRADWGDDELDDGFMHTVANWLEAVSEESNIFGEIPQTDTNGYAVAAARAYMSGEEE